MTEAYGDVFGNKSTILRGNFRPEVILDNRNPDSSPTLLLVVNKRD